MPSPIQAEPYKEWRREICGSFPSGYRFCTIIGQDNPTNPDWLQFRDDTNGRVAWAKFRLGHCCETEPTEFDHPANWKPE